MKVSDLKFTLPVAKPRDPNHSVLANKRNAGGKMIDKKKKELRGDVKHKGRAYEEILEI